MKIHVARQPIFNRKLSVYGYELLYRRNQEEMALKGNLDGNKATSRVILDSFFGFGIENFTGNRKAFINFTEDLLDREIATLFPPEKLVIEVLEDIQARDSIIKKCHRLRALGYEIALDDYVLNEQTRPFMEVADIVKIDFKITPIEEMRDLITNASGSMQFLAEKIETHEEYKLARSMGFTYFQGFFLNRPETFSRDDLPPLHVNYLNLMDYINSKEFSIKKLEDIIRHDVALTYKLLQLVNSVAFGLRQHVRSVHHALVMLGHGEVRKWITLLAMTGVSDHQNQELMCQSLIRAKFAEGLARIVYEDEEIIDQIFMMGLFSLIDAIVHQCFEEVFENMEALNTGISDALVEHKGSFVPYLEIITHYEKGDIGPALMIAKKLEISSDQVGEAYRDALGWSIGVFG